MRDDACGVVADITGRTPRNARKLGGGDTAEAFVVELDDGTAVFAKATDPAMPAAAAAEAASLSWLHDSATVAIPSVYGHRDGWLVTEHVTPSSPSSAAAEQFGHDLAGLHATGAPEHGAPPPGGPADAWIGLAPMRNEPASSWPVFYVEQRVLPYLRRAVDEGALGSDEAAVIERVCDRIDEVAGPAEPPARLHGDLWSGNVHWSDQVWLIDPAAHGGHRETDLAMLRLFGCPQLERIIGAYQDASPLAAGWQDRVGLHQLFPLLVHAVLFGRGFAEQAVAAARSTLATA